MRFKVILILKFTNYPHQKILNSILVTKVLLVFNNFQKYLSRINKST